jgi:hypothetical protein
MHYVLDELIARSTCMTRAHRILYIAELVSRFDPSPIHQNHRHTMLELVIHHMLEKY